MKVVIASRFVAILRQIAGLLAGATRMPWPRFLIANAVGSILWAAGYGLGAEALGDTLKNLAGPMAIGLGVLVAAGIVAGILFVRHHERRLMARATRRAQV